MRSLRRYLVGSLALVAIAATALMPNTAEAASATHAAVTSRTIGVDRLPDIFDIMVDPGDPNSVLLATQGGLYRARQDGRAERLSRSSNAFWRLTPINRPGKRFLALGRADDGRAAPLLLSDDQGRSWRAPAPPNFDTTYLRLIEASKVASRYIYGASYSLFWASTDGGSTWVSSTVPKDRIIDLAASALDARRIFAATLSGLRVSNDGGRSWKPVNGPRCRQPVIAVDIGADSTVYAFSLCAGLLRGNEAGGAWKVVSNRFGGCIVQHLAVDPRDSDRLYAVIRCRKVIVSADGGFTWRELGSTVKWNGDCIANAVLRTGPHDRS
jgi:hypothetical protein